MYENGEIDPFLGKVHKFTENESTQYSFRPSTILPSKCFPKREEKIEDNHKREQVDNTEVEQKMNDEI